MKETKYKITDDNGRVFNFSHKFDPRSIFTHQHKPLNIADTFKRIPNAKKVEVLGLEFEREQFNLEKVYSPTVVYYEYDSESNLTEQVINSLGGFATEEEARREMENWGNELCGEVHNSYIEIYWHVKS